MPRKKQPDLDPDEQKKRFEALARQTGASASAEQFREAVKRIAKARLGKKPEKSGE